MILRCWPSPRAVAKAADLWKSDGVRALLSLGVLSDSMSACANYQTAALDPETAQLQCMDFSLIKGR